MKTPIVVFCATAIVLGCSPAKDKETEKPKEPAAATAATSEAKGASESRVKHGTNGSVVITLDAATRKLMGLQTASLEGASLSPEVKAYGRVLDASPLTTIVADMSGAAATAQASEAELKRLKALAAQSNASERALQTAEAAAIRDQSIVEASHLRLLASWGGAISHRKDLPEFVRSLSSLASCLVQLDVPASQPLPGTPTAARVLSLAAQATPVAAQLLGPATVVDPQMQGRGFLVWVNPNDSHLAPGAAVTGFLAFSGEPRQGVALPEAAVVRFNGANWVYVQTGDDSFERVRADLDAPLSAGWFVQKGLKTGDKIVTVGAQQLLSEELKTSGSEE